MIVHNCNLGPKTWIYTTEPVITQLNWYHQWTRLLSSLQPLIHSNQWKYPMYIIVLQHAQHWCTFHTLTSITWLNPQVEPLDQFTVISIMHTFVRLTWGQKLQHTLVMNIYATIRCKFKLSSMLILHVDGQHRALDRSQRLTETHAQLSTTKLVRIQGFNTTPDTSPFVIPTGSTCMAPGTHGPQYQLLRPQYQLL